MGSIAEKLLIVVAALALTTLSQVHLIVRSVFTITSQSDFSLPRRNKHLSVLHKILYFSLIPARKL